MNNFINEDGKILLKFDVEMEDFSKAGEASSKIKNILRQLGINGKVIRKVSIATYEAEINVAIHSLGGFIELRVLEDKILIRVKDKGPGIKDVDLAMQKGYSTATEEVRELGFGAGMGLPNMKRYSDEFEIESVYEEYTEINMVMYIE